MGRLVEVVAAADKRAAILERRVPAARARGTLCFASRRQPVHPGARAARLLGYFLVSFGTLGMQYAFGPIYAELLTQLQGSREVTSRAHMYSTCASPSGRLAVPLQPHSSR